MSTANSCRVTRPKAVTSLEGLLVPGLHEMLNYYAVLITMRYERSGYASIQCDRLTHGARKPNTDASTTQQTLCTLLTFSLPRMHSSSE